MQLKLSLDSSTKKKVEKLDPIHCSSCSRRATIYIDKTHFCVTHALEHLNEG